MINSHNGSRVGVGLRWAGLNRGWSRAGVAWAGHWAGLGWFAARLCWAGLKLVWKLTGAGLG